MTNFELGCFTVFCVCMAFAVGLVVAPYLANRAETRFSGPPDGQTGEPGPVTAAPLLNAPLAAVSGDPTPYARRSPFEHERDDAPLTWPGPVLPEGFARTAIAQADRKLHIQREILSRRPSDAGLCGLARRDAAGWPAWHEWRLHVQGGEDDAGEPQGRAGE